MKLDIYYAMQRDERNRLAPEHPSGCCLIIPVQPGNTGPCEVTVPEAARWIVEGRFRLATQGEADKFCAQRDAARARCAPDSLARTRALFDAAMTTKGPTRA